MQNQGIVYGLNYAVNRLEVAYTKLLVEIPLTNPSRENISPALAEIRDAICDLTGEWAEDVQNRNQGRAYRIMYEGIRFADAFLLYPVWPNHVPNEP